MYSELLNYTWKGITGYAYAYILISNKSKMAEIRSKKTIVLWGGTPQTSIAKHILEKNGIANILVASFYWKEDILSSYFDVINYKKVLDNPQDYYHIIDSSNMFECKESFKLLQYAGIDDFSILFSGYTKDFSERRRLQNAFWNTLNEVFLPVNFLGNWKDIMDCKLYSLEGAGFWDVPYMLIYNLYRHKPLARYLEVGPGYGIMSLSLKKLMNIDVTWLVIPSKDDERDYNKKVLSVELSEKYSIHTIEGYLEIDNFVGNYDIIVMTQVMEHFVCNPVGSLKKLRDLLSEDGCMFISVPEETKWYQVESYKEMPYASEISSEEYKRRNIINEYAHFHEYSYQEAMSVFEESGFQCINHVFTAPVHHFMLKKR